MRARDFEERTEEPDTNFWDFLSKREANFVNEVIGSLGDVDWVRPLIADIERNGGLNRTNKARFFELRFGYALYQTGIAPRYEVPGTGASTIDFEFVSNHRKWLVELLRLEETLAVKNATRSFPGADGYPLAELHLHTDANNPTHSIEGETLKAIQRICQKCERDGQPHKFPKPSHAVHVILVDVSNFAEGGDPWDRIHIGLGGEYVPGPFKMYWQKQLISGVFNERTRLKGAAEMRERVHFLGFIHEKKFEEGALSRGTQFIANPYLFCDVEEARSALADWPLQPTQALNLKSEST